MKIGILTFHRAENFGAVLQCYALQQYLKSLGHDVWIIDYRCEAIEKVYYIYNLKILLHRLNLFSSIRQYIKRLSFRKDKVRKKSCYKLFRKDFLHISQPVYQITKDLGYDVYITGSDQVWNTILTHGYVKEYFLDFPISRNSRKIAYAVSSEESANEKLRMYKEQINKALSTFYAISVREDNLKIVLSEFITNEINVCIDPTFLLNYTDYQKIAIKPTLERYVLVYHMAETVEGSMLADKLALSHGLKIIEIHANFAERDRTRHLQDVGPLELLGYIIYADFVITTSFHGLALSLINRKNFYVLSKKENVRLQNLLNIVGLENRIISNIENVGMESIDYELISDKISMLSTFSKEFLKNSIS